MATASVPNVRMNLSRFQPGGDVDSPAGSVNSSITSSRNPSSLFPQRGLPSDHFNGVGVVNPNQNDANPVNQIGQRDISIEVVPPVDVANPPNPALRNSEQIAYNRLFHSAVMAQAVRPSIVGAGTGPTFAQRNPFLAKLFSGIVAVLAFPVLFVGTALATPFLIGAAFFSQACGTGKLAKDIGASAIAKVLWGDMFAKQMEEGRTDSFGLAIFGILSVFGLTAPGFAALGAERVYLRTLKLLGKVDSDDSVHVDDSVDNDSEARAIERALREAPPLDKIVQSWLDALPKEEGAKIDLKKWSEFNADSSQDEWTKPLAANLERWLSGALRIDPEKTIALPFFNRMVRVLQVIECDPKPFIKFLFSIGVSGLISCHDRPATVFLDLEREIQDHQDFMGFQAGTKTLQDLLDGAVKRMIFKETHRQLVIGMQTARPKIEDPVQAVMEGWQLIEESGTLDIPHLPYRTWRSYATGGQVKKITTDVVSGLTEAMKSTDIIDKFLDELDPSSPWKRAVASLRLEMNQDKVAEKQEQIDALVEPDGTNFESTEHKAYYAAAEVLRAELASLRKIPILFVNGEGKAKDRFKVDLLPNQMTLLPEKHTS